MQGRLERVVQHQHEEKELRLPQQLLRMEIRAEAARGDAMRGFATVKQELQSAFDLTDEQVRCIFPYVLTVTAMRIS